MAKNHSPYHPALRAPRRRRDLQLGVEDNVVFLDGERPAAVLTGFSLHNSHAYRNEILHFVQNDNTVMAPLRFARPRHWHAFVDSRHGQMSGSGGASLARASVALPSGAGAPGTGAA